MNIDLAANSLCAGQPVPPVVERRRRGRVAYEGPELIRLLRDPAPMEFGTAADVLRAEAEVADNLAIERASDDLSAAKGIMLAIPLALFCWGMIWVVVRLFLLI